MVEVRVVEVGRAMGGVAGLEVVVEEVVVEEAAVEEVVGLGAGV